MEKWSVVASADPVGCWVVSPLGISCEERKLQVAEPIKEKPSFLIAPASPPLTKRCYRMYLPDRQKGGPCTARLYEVATDTNNNGLFEKISPERNKEIFRKSGGYLTNF